jgi:hypothetical protein
MQLLLISILADSDSSGKPFFIAFVIAIWIIGSIVSSIRKATASRSVQQEKASLRATRQAMQLPAVAQSHPRWQPAKVPAHRLLKQPVKRPVKQPASRRPPPIPAKTAAAPARKPQPGVLQRVESIATQAAPRQPARAASAVSLHRWLTPKTLRQQFILTEVLQPPLALRPPRTD